MSTRDQITLRNTHVVVFGGGSGIGLATAIAAKNRGASVTLVGRTRAKLKAAVVAVGGAQIAVADIADRRAVEAVFHPMQRVDHLVITAGGLRAGKVADRDPDDLLSQIRDRISGPLYAIKAALPLIPPTGSIVLTGGQYADRPTGSGVAVVAAAVCGVEALARALALDIKPIRVNVIAPGIIDTPLFDVFSAEARAEIFKDAAMTLPVGRAGSADEVGEAITFLLCNGYMNGEVLHVDGGGRLV